MKSFVALFLLTSLAAAQQPAATSAGTTPAKPADAAKSEPRKVDKAAAYYHFTMAHMYEEQMAAYGRSDLVSKALEEYRLAMEADPGSEYLSSGLAELYARTGRIKDAVGEAQEILQRDPQNLEAHRLLGHIYLRSLGEIQNGSGSDSVLKLAIDQYEQIIKLDPSKTAALHNKLYQPPQKEVVLVPTSRETAQTWRYSETKPADGWEKPGFDDASWKEGSGGFGEPTTPGSKVHTTWKTPDLWLRRTFELPTAAPGKADGLTLSIHHDEDAEVYLNGTLIGSVKGYVTDYILVPLDDKAAAALKSGKNILAVHCHQTGGGQYIDVGLSRLEEPTPIK
jgi:tetratricopeptide (TPR) repeat protein